MARDVMAMNSRNYTLSVREGAMSLTEISVDRTLAMDEDVSVFVSKESGGLNSASCSSGWQKIRMSVEDRQAVNTLVQQIAQRGARHAYADNVIERLQELWSKYI